MNGRQKNTKKMVLYLLEKRLCLNKSETNNNDSLVSEIE